MKKKSKKCCKLCGKTLTGKQKKFCSKRCKNKHWKQNNPEKCNVYNEKFIEKNPNYNKERYQNNKKKINEQNKEWKQNNPEKVKKINRKHRQSKKGIKYDKEWKQNNPEKCKKSCRKRRAMKNNIIETYTQQEWEAKLFWSFGYCLSCGRFVGINNLQLDHIFPISKAEKGRIYTINDIQPICKSCNCSKWNKEPKGDKNE